jgi:hypothetical protein
LVQYPLTTRPFQKGIRTLALAVAVVLSGCGGESRSARPISISLDQAAQAVVVTGLSSAELGALQQQGMQSDSLMQALLRVDVAIGGALAIVGSYVLSDSALEFRPRFPFDAGRSYRVTFNPARLPVPRGEQPTVATVSIPAGDRTPTTRVVQLYPTVDTVPENLLRLYVEFSAPMSSTGGLDFVKLVDDAGQEVKQAFLPLEADFWNRERTRYTLFLDPGRVKQGILPNEQLGRPLLRGRRYAITIDSSWLDGNGLPLTRGFRREFVVTAPDEKMIDTKSWAIIAPAGGTKDALVVKFAKPLDHGLLLRALGVALTNGSQILGTVEIANREREWRFTPGNAWKPGAHHLIVLDILEDPVGNRIDRPFEVDMFDRIDRKASPERRSIPFVVR